MIPVALYQYSYLPLSETFIYRQLQGIAQRFDVRLYTMSRENMDLFPGFNPIVVPEKSVWERLSGKYRTTYFTPSRKKFIVNILRDTRLLYVNFGHMALSMQDMAAEAGIPLVVFFHGVDASAFLRDRNYQLEYQRSNFHTVFTNSENMKARLAPNLPETTNVKVVRYGIPLELFPFKQRTVVPKDAMFLQVSRLDYKKGVDVSLEVFARYIRDVSSGARFVIAGDGPLRSELQLLTSKLGIERHVTFLGKVNQVRVLELLHEADVLLQHSVVAPDGDMEGVPNILIEAMACGVPVVSTYHSGIPELITNGHDGVLVQEHDTEAYFNALTSLRKLDIATISKNARNTVEERFNSKVNNELLCTYMTEVVA